MSDLLSSLDGHATKPQGTALALPLDAIGVGKRRIQILEHSGLDRISWEDPPSA